ncbi:hypothetical protein E2562_031095 [Oryza meyeriana var. granulata]|uniref:Uncharacterized protein n=1 Tax=Oryza meyeriana var. granulata TaxID=110450 RepID=A0A6G1E4R4_9ORYZ|nr:hypothetical protein E2562_031095 [Oryza meyeriana var. granulata]
MDIIGRSMSSSECGELLPPLQNISSMEMTMPMGSDTLRQGSTTTRNSSHTVQVRCPYDPSIVQQQGGRHGLEVRICP